MRVSPETIEGLIKAILRSGFDDATETPEFHRELWELLCSPNKYVAAAAPRGHAKTTAGTFAYGLAKMLFRESRYVIIVSDTEGQAQQFLGNIRQEIQSNQSLDDLFGLKKNDKGEVQFLKDTNTDIIVEFEDGYTFRVIAKGAEQKLRGLNWNGTRPDLILGDDMENDESVMNKERREKLKRWFRAALLPSLSPKGLVRIVGTVLHMDSLLENLMPPLHDKHTITQGLKQITGRGQGSWRAVRWKAHNEDFSLLLWPDRFPNPHFPDLYQEHFNSGMTDVYSQEYLNYPIDEKNTYFKRTEFQPMTPKDKEKRLNYYITADLAISQKERADYTVFLVAGVDENKRVYVVNVIRERLDGKEIVDSILYLQRLYEPVAFGIEKMQVSQAIGPFLHEEMIKQQIFPQIVELATGGQDKIMRGRSMQAMMKLKACFFDKEADWYSTFEDELMTFPRAKHDDQFDCFSYVGKMLRMLVEANTDKEQVDEEYAESLTDYGDEGRNQFTGY